MAVHALGRHSRVVRTGQALSGGLATVLATVAAELPPFSTVRFSGRTYPKLARILRELCAVAGRCCLPLVCSHRCCQPRWRGGRLRIASGRARPHPRPAPPRPGCGPCAPPLPHRTDCCHSYSPERRCQGLICVYVHQALSPVLVVLRSDRRLMPDRRRITIRRQSGGEPLQFPRSSGTRWSSSNSCVFGLRGSYLVAEAQGRQCSVAESPRVIAVLIPAGGGNGPVFGPLDCDVADDEQCGVRVFRACLTSLRVRMTSAPSVVVPFTSICFTSSPRRQIRS